MRRRREDNRDQNPKRPARGASERRATFQSDSLARAPYPAYEDYEIYEEFAAEQPPPPAQGQSRATLVMPAVTLPSVPTVQTPEGYTVPRHRTAGWRRTGGPDLSDEADEAIDPEEDDEGWLVGKAPAPRRSGVRRAQRATGSHAAAPAPDSRAASWHNTQTGAWGAATRTTLAPRPQNPHHRLTHAERIAPAAVPVGRVRRLTQRVADIVFIPAARHVMPKPIRAVFGRIFGFVGAIARRPALASLVVLAMLVLGILADVTGAAQEAGLFSASAWRALAGSVPSTNALVNGPITAPPVYDAKHFMQKYGFFQPGPATGIGADETARLVQMLPSAIRAAEAYDKRYNKSIEPQMLLYWTHAEGIRARINYSNCANEDPRPGTSWNTDIENCNHASFWQLGYGNQFGVIYVLRNAFTDLYGDPNDTQLVAKVGQWVLDFDQQIGTTPACGGYACAFPAKSIDDILSGVNLRTGVVAEDNWWASVLSRDPAINCYMIAHALTFFSHEATRNWVGCYFAAPCWQRNSDRLGDILTAWPDLLKATGLQG
jgi:hypothetical protein